MKNSPRTELSSTPHKNSSRLMTCNRTRQSGSSTRNTSHLQQDAAIRIIHQKYWSLAKGRCHPDHPPEMLVTCNRSLPSGSSTINNCHLQQVAAIRIIHQKYKSLATGRCHRGSSTRNTNHLQQDEAIRII